jgi:hypothetical protein
MITVGTSLIASVLLSVSLAHATDVEVTPVPESEINYDLDLTIDLSDIDAEDIANVQDEIKAMEEAEDPYLYFDGLPDLEQRSIIAAMDQGQVNIKDPDEVWGFEFEQDAPDPGRDRDGDGDVDYDDKKHKLKMEAKEMALCLKWVSFSDCKWAAKAGQRIEAQMKAKYGAESETLKAGPGDAHRHCVWNAHMRIALGEFPAQHIADNHEKMNLEEERRRSERQPTGEKKKEYRDKADKESKMDVFNNLQGRIVGQAYAFPPDYEKADKKCEEWSKNGMLKILHNGDGKWFVD